MIFFKWTDKRNDIAVILTGVFILPALGGYMLASYGCNPDVNDCSGLIKIGVVSNVTIHEDTRCLLLLQFNNTSNEYLSDIALDSDCSNIYNLASEFKIGTTRSLLMENGRYTLDIYKYKDR